jgi:hypothetical protein
VDLTTALPSGKTLRRFYAVVHCRNLGVFDEWRTVLASVSGHPHPKYKRFRHREMAEEWYLQQLQIIGIIPPETGLLDDDVSVDDTVDYNSKGMPNVGRSGPPRPQPPARPADVYPTPARSISNVNLVDFRMAGPDLSTGDPKTIHNISINITSDVRDLLCPKGLTQEMQS